MVFVCLWTKKARQDLLELSYKDVKALKFKESSYLVY